MLVVLFALGASAEARSKPKARAKKIQESQSELTEAQRSSLRFRLENIWNEVDLLVRNANSDRLDVQRQEREFKVFGIFQKIPIGAVEPALKSFASAYGLNIEKLKVVDVSKPDRPLPEAVYTDGEGYRLSDDQIAERVRVELTIVGTKDQVQQWMDHWGDVRNPEHPSSGAETSIYVEWDPQASRTLPDSLPQSRWRIHAQVYRFRDIQYPPLKSREPLEILPEWARKNQVLFKSKEPLLWSFVEKTHALLPKALPQFDLKRKFMLNSARMNFFISKLGQG